MAKKEKPKIYSTRDNFKANSQNEYTIRQPDYVESLHNFRLFFNDEKTRGIIFDFNNFKSKEGKNVKTPCLFLFNYWEEKAENIKFPDKDDGMFNFLKNSILFNFFPDVIIFVWYELVILFVIKFVFFIAFAGKRETTSKFKPQDIPLLEKGLTTIKLMNPNIFNRITFKSDFDPHDFVKRVMQSRNSKPAEVEEIEDVQRREAHNGVLPSLV